MKFYETQLAHVLNSQHIDKKLYDKERALVVAKRPAGKELTRLQVRALEDELMLTFESWPAQGIWESKEEEKSMKKVITDIEVSK